MSTLQSTELRQFIEDLYVKNGFPLEQAKICAWHTTLAELWGVKTHGINLLGWYIGSIQSENIKKNPDLTWESKGNAIHHLDVGGAHGQVATYKAAEKVIEELSNGASASSVGITSSNHFGMAGAPAYQIAKQGYIGILLSSTPPIIAATGTRERSVGSNPLAIAFPRIGKEPTMLDMSLSVCALNRIVIARRKGIPIHDHAYLNIDGNFATTVDEVDEYKLAAPLGGLEETGGYKGYGLAFMFELLVACLLGGKTSAELINWKRDEKGPAPESHMVIGIKPDIFRSLNAIDNDIEELVSFIHCRAKRGDEGDVFVPGEDRDNRKRRQEESGMELEPWQGEIIDELRKNHEKKEVNSLRSI